jgi:hypothetical protein
MQSKVPPKSSIFPLWNNGFGWSWTRLSRLYNLPWASQDFFQSMKGPLHCHLWTLGNTTPPRPDCVDQPASRHGSAINFTVLRPCTYGQDEKRSGFSHVDKSPRCTANLTKLSSCPDYVVTTCKYQELRQSSSRSLQPGGPKGGWFIDTLPLTYFVQGMGP